MRSYGKRIALVAAMGMLLSTSSASAGGAYAGIYKNAQSSIQVFKMLTGAAKKAAAERKPAATKLVCVAALAMVWRYLGPRSTFASRNKAAFAAYDATCTAAYKGHKPDPAGFDAVVAQYKDKLTEYGFALAFEPFGKPRTPTGSGGYISAYDRHRRMVEAAMLRPIARAYAMEFVGKLPAPGPLILNLIKHKSRDFEELPAHLVSIVFGKYSSEQKLKKGGIAGIISNADKFVNRFNPKMSMGQMDQQVDGATKWIALLKTAAPKHPKLATYDASIKKIQASVRKRWKEALAKRRMPDSSYGGKGKAKLLKFVRATYKASYGKYDKVIRVVINTGNWTVPRGQGYWKDKRWYWKVYSKLSPITVAVQEKRHKGKKTYEMFKVTLIRERRGSGWSKPYMVGNAIPVGSILKKNINK